MLYHWAATAPDAEAADERYGQSVELSYEELKHAILSFGMQFEVRRRRQRCLRPACGLPDDGYSHSWRSGTAAPMLPTARP